MGEDGDRAPRGDDGVGHDAKPDVDLVPGLRHYSQQQKRYCPFAGDKVEDAQTLSNDFPLHCFDGILRGDVGSPLPKAIARANRDTRRERDKEQLSRSLSATHFIFTSIISIHFCDGTSSHTRESIKK